MDGSIDRREGWESEESEAKDKKARDEMPWRVYCAHALSTWGDNMWWFAGGCYMLKLQPESLRLTAIYGLVIAGTVILFGASVGKWIDRTRRLTAARTFLTIQNTAVSMCALLLAGFLHYQEELEPDGTGPLTAMVSVASIFLASVGRLASTGTNIIIQKDWIVVIAAGDNDRLATMNSILRTIELTTYMLAPAVTGQLFTFLGFTITGVLLAAWNVASVMLEYLLLALIYRKYPSLSNKRVAALELDRESEEQSGEKKGALKEALEGWAAYFSHPVMKAGLALACLFMTVLGFDNITYGFVLMQGVPHAALGVLVGVSALVGVAGSLSYPVIRRRVGLERTGLLGMFLLISCSSLALLSVFLPGSPMDLSVLVHGNSSSIEIENGTLLEPIPWNMAEVRKNTFWFRYCSVLVFLTGIILARFGLWIVDLTVNQLLQEKVEEDKRGVINGVQDSLNNSLDLAKCVLVILLPAQETFGLLIAASYVAINFGWLMYALYSRSQRGHLFHFRRLAASLVCLPDPDAKKNRSDPIEPGEMEKMMEERKDEKDPDKMAADIEEKLNL